jgi:NAD(P)-dependent dehydrogenase (short-subunit alcohol dehydrogenase family)
MTDLSGKVAIVLGASAKGGTGWAVAERYAAAGARVVVGARRLEPLNVLAERIGGLAVACDAGEEDQVAALADAAISAYGRLDVAVNSAGLPVFGRIADITPDLLLEAAKYNYFAQAYFFKHMGRVMSDGGSMIAISSISSVLFNGHISPYACAKAAANCLVKYAAVEYGPRGIRVNAILPGPIRSEMARELLAVPGMEEAFTREVSLGRIGEPADFADACLWLAGSAYITGESLHINGGMQLNRFPRAEEFPGGGPPFYEVAS